MKIKLFHIALLLSSFQFQLIGQNKIDEKLINKLFWEGKYNEVEQDYYILYLQNLNDPEICFKYGTALLFESDSVQNLLRANNLLLFSVSQSNALAEYHFFCGRAYHARSVFDSAIVQFELYKSKKGKKTIDLPVDEYIRYCMNGQSMQKLSKGSFELQQSDIEYDQIGLAYTLPQIKLNGEFINYNTELTKIDLKKENKPVRYVSDYPTKYFASFGEKDDGHRDLYMVEGSREQKKITKLPEFINTKEDEAFPYYDSETNYLYFSSKGHNSMGGYDIYRVEFDTLTESFGKVENLGVGISTPFDDYLFIYNSRVNQALLTSAYLGKTNKYAIFSGKITIIDKLQTKKLDVLATFKNEVNSNIKLSEIKVIDKNSEEIIGKFKVDESGKTIMNLAPGEYTYFISIYGSQDDFRADISIPSDDKEIMHEIIYKLDEKNNEEVVINDENSNTVDVIATNIKKENENQELISKTSDTAADKENLIDTSLEKEALEKLDMVGFNQNEVVDRVSDKIIEIEIAQKENEQLMSNLNVVIVNNRNYYDELQQEIDSIEKNINDFSELEKIEKFNYIKNLVAEQNEVMRQTLWMQNLNDSLHILNSESNPEKRKFNEIQQLGDVIQDLTIQNKYEDAYAKIIKKHEQIHTISINPVSEKIYSDLHENELEQARIEKNILSLSAEFGNLKEELKSIDLEINDASKKEKIQLETKREEIQQKINSNQKQTKAYQRELQDLKSLTADFELKRNLITKVAKEEYEEDVSYEDAKKKYFIPISDYQSKLDLVQEKIEVSNNKLNSAEKKYLVVVESYQTKKNTLDDNITQQQLIELEQELANNIQKLLTEENTDIENSSSAIHENYLQEKLQESQNRLSTLTEDKIELTSNSTNENEESTAVNSDNNITKIQGSTNQNKEQNQANNSSNSTNENEESTAVNTDNNIAKNQSTNTQNNKQNQANTSSNSTNENEESTSENSDNNIAKNQSANTQNNLQNQANTSSNSTDKNEESTAVNTENNIAKNQSSNTQNNQQNQTITSSNSTNENKESSTITSNNSIAKNQSSNTQNNQENQANTSSNSTNENEESTAVNTENNIAKNQNSNTQNNQENQANTSSNSTNENEESTAVNTENNIAKNQNSNTQNNQENQANTSSNSTNENEESTAVNTENNIAKNQNSNTQNNQENQANTSSNSTNENEESTAVNTENNIAKNQNSNTQNNQENQTNTSSNSTNENEESTAVNTENNIAKNQNSNTQNNQQNQANTSSNSTDKNEESTAVNTENNIAKNQNSNTQNNQENQANTSSNSINENEESSTENSDNNIAKNQNSNTQNNQENQANTSSNSINENEESSTENSDNNIAKNQSSNTQNNQENQANTSSNSTNENEESTAVNTENNIAKNQNSNTQNNQQNQANTSSNSTNENEESTAVNTENNIAKNQNSNTQNNQQNQANTSSNSTNKNEESTTVNTENNIAKNQNSNTQNNQQNQANTSSNSTNENEESTFENSENKIAKNQSEYIPRIEDDIKQIENDELISISSEFIHSKNQAILELKKENPSIQLQSTKQLKFEQSKIENQLLNTKSEIEELKVQQTSEKNRKNRERLENSIIEKQKELEILSNMKDEIENQITEQEKENISLNLNENLISLEEQKSKEILSSNGYKEYVKAIVQFEKEKENFEEISEKLETEQIKMNELLNIQILSKDKRIGSIEIESLTQEIEKSQKSQESSYNKLIELKKSVEKVEQENQSISNEMKALAASRKEPITKIEVVNDEIIASGGFKIMTASDVTTKENNTIPINVKVPSGLTYRIQIGAFRKPLQNNVFTQFTPVSGELQQNGLTVYMAGYFNSSNNAINARKQIQSLGYSDAFIVAYCNGKKLTLGEARQLEARGECIPQGDNEFLVEISKNTKDALKQENISLSSEKTPSIDTKNLFFTVQIGVYNKPINEKEKFPGLLEISSSISPKKQIRYSTGKFSDLNTAKTRKNEAVAAGISDAFIVAYYQGERITIAQASELLTKNEALLDANSKQSEAITRKESVQFVENETKLFSNEKKDVKIEKIQYEVNTTFDDFPIEKLVYFNQYGLFQFNKLSGKLISTTFSRELDLADELKLSGIVTELKEEKTEEMNELKLEDLKGDLMDVLLRTNWVQSIERSNEISLILNSNFSTSENYTNLLKNTFDIKTERYDKK